ncbi:SecE/sec61-gamma family protein translocase subunit [[Eubacterium] cellulosolvens]
MPVRNFLTSARRLLHVTTRPTRTELWLMVKVCFLGIAIVGGLGYVVRMLFMFVGLLPTGP